MKPRRCCSGCFSNKDASCCRCYANKGEQVSGYNIFSFKCQSWESHHCWGISSITGNIHLNPKFTAVPPCLIRQFRLLFSQTFPSRCECLELKTLPRVCQTGMGEEKKRAHCRISGGIPAFRSAAAAVLVRTSVIPEYTFGLKP